MHRFPRSACLTLAALAAGALEAHAGPITYRFVSYPSLQNGYTLDGTITTNGTIGPLSGTDVIAWTWNITDGINSDTQSGTDLSPGTAGLAASATQLTVSGSAGQVVFQGPPSTYLEYASHLNNYDAAILGGLRAWSAATTPTSLGGDPWVIARVESQAYFLHGTGGTANPPVLSLDTDAPLGLTPRYKDSPSVNFSGGNSWKSVGTWTAEPSSTTGLLTGVGTAQSWVGLKNSDDVGTRFDLRIEVSKNGAQLVAVGETYCVQGLVRSPTQASMVTTSFSTISPTEFDGASDQMTVKVLTRIGTNGLGVFCGGHVNAVGLRLYFDAASRQSQLDATFQP